MEDQILIIDDEEWICSLLASRIIMEKYYCVVATTSKEALHHFYKHQFSLIICDLKMPGMDGLKLLEKMKALDPETMMIMITGYPDIEVAVKAMRMGAYDFMIKPFNLELMVSTVKRALEKKEMGEKLKMVINTWRN